MSKAALMGAGVILVLLQAPLLGPLMQDSMQLALAVFLLQVSFALGGSILLEVKPPVGARVSTLVKASFLTSLAIFGVGAAVILASNAST